MKRLESSFFLRDTELVARELIGTVLTHEVEGEERKVRLVETEAYLGELDPAAHSYRGPTKRNAAMFEEGGILYVYFIYGMHWCANIVTEGKGRGRAVLLRAGIADDGHRIDGPARLTKYLGLTGADTGRSVLKDGLALHVDDDSASWRSRILVTPRIGITRAADLPLRFVVPRIRDASRRA